MNTTKSIPYKVSRSSSSFSSKELSENDRFLRRKAKIQLQKRQRKTNQKKLLRTQYPQDMDIDQKEAHKQSKKKTTQKDSVDGRQIYRTKKKKTTQKDSVDGRQIYRTKKKKTTQKDSVDGRQVYQRNKRKDTQKQTATVTEQNGILGQRKHYNNTELNIMIMSKNSEHNDGHFQQVRRVSAILIHLIPIE
jgi:hypothetical protein